MHRYTRGDVFEAFNKLRAVLGDKAAHWFLSRTAHGYQIADISDGSMPFGNYCRPATEFCKAVELALSVLERVVTPIHPLDSSHPDIYCSVGDCDTEATWKLPDDKVVCADHVPAPSYSVRQEIK